uniref:Peptidase S1 domain-containing protein n=1 Tax=Panagrolaimus superbus TaxID=310955 RepID=A0A914Z5U9_9BILA
MQIGNKISEKTLTFLNTRSPGPLVEYHPEGKILMGLDFHDYSFQTRYYFHPSYFSVHAYKHDIAIIEFPEDTDFQIPPIKLASNYVEKDGDMAIAAGYGFYKWQGSQITGTPEHPKVLQNATVPVHASCPGISSASICSATCERHADQGDSGGPLMFKRNGTYYQVGVFSTINPYNETFIINTYTRLSLECEWIKKITKGEAKCEPLPEDPNPQPSKPVALNQPKCAPVKPASQPDEEGHVNPADQTEIPSDQTGIPSDENGVTAPQISQTEALKSNSNFAALNIILFFAAFFFFD